MSFDFSITAHIFLLFSFITFFFLSKSLFGSFSKQIIVSQFCPDPTLVSSLLSFELHRYKDQRQLPSLTSFSEKSFTSPISSSIPLSKCDQAGFSSISPKSVTTIQWQTHGLHANQPLHRSSTFKQLWTYLLPCPFVIIYDRFSFYDAINSLSQSILHSVIKHLKFVISLRLLSVPSTSCSTDSLPQFSSAPFTDYS
jgi:hypothetical protein